MILPLPPMMNPSTIPLSKDMSDAEFMALLVPLVSLAIFLAWTIGRGKGE